VASEVVDVPSVGPVRAPSVIAPSVARAVVAIDALDVGSRVLAARSAVLARGHSVTAARPTPGLDPAVAPTTEGRLPRRSNVVDRVPVVASVVDVPTVGPVRGPSAVAVASGPVGGPRRVGVASTAGSVPTVVGVRHRSATARPARPERLVAAASRVVVVDSQGREVRVTRPVGHRSPDSPAAARASALPRVAAASAPCRAAAPDANHGPEDPGVRVEVGEAAVGAEPAPASPG
jgi:hypothetical protein